MQLSRYYSSLFYFIEQSLDWWDRQPQSRITVNPDTRLPTGGIGTLAHNATFNVVEGLLKVLIPSAKEYDVYDSGKYAEKYKNSPYKQKIVFPDYDGKLINHDGFYTTRILWDNFYRVFNDWLKDMEDREDFSDRTQKEMVEDMIYNQNVKFDCDCPAFHYQGMRYALSTINSAIDPTNISSRVWLSRHNKSGARYPLCKHLIAILKDLKEPEKYFYNKIRYEINPYIENQRKKFIQNLVGQR